MNANNGATAEYAAGGRSKVDRYNWKPIDQPGVYRDIDKKLLRVDRDHYQRDDTDSKVRRIAAAWSWVACGTLLVAERPDGTLWVYDGGHRLAAAMRRADIATLPCLVFPSGGLQAESQGFLDVNTNRKACTTLQKFRAFLTAGDRCARVVQELLAGSGYEMCHKPREGCRDVKCIGSLMMMAELDADVLREMWPLVVHVSNNGPVKERTLCSITYLEWWLRRKHPELSLTRQPWRRRLESLDQNELIVSIAKAASFYARGGLAVWASGLAQALNKGVQKRLPSPRDGRPASEGGSE